MRKAVVAIVALVMAAIVGFVSPASAATYYYAGGSGNAYTSIVQRSYSSPSRYAGNYKAAAGFYTGNCAGTNTLCSEPLTGSSTKWYWQPCVGYTDITPRCNNPEAEALLVRVQMIDDYGTIVTAETTTYSAAVMADDANSAPNGDQYYFLPHITGLGNMDYVASNSGQAFSMTTHHVSGTYGFTTQVPLTWHPKMCYVFNVYPSVLHSTEIWSYSVCAPIYPH